MNTQSSLRKTWNILMPFLIYFVAHDLAQVLLAFLMNVSLVRLGETYVSFMTDHAVTVNGVLNALALLIGMAFVWPMASRELRLAKESRANGISSAQRKTGALLLQYGLLLIFALSLALGTNILLSLTGVTGESTAYSRIAEKQYGVAFGVGLVIYGILSPLAEETVFRGLIYNRMKRCFSTAISIVACGILFGVYHGNLVQGLYGCILGLAITLIYELFASFAAPVLFHAAANVGVFIIGYRKEVFEKLLTPGYCVIFLLFAVVSLVLIFKQCQDREEWRRPGDK